MTGCNATRRPTTWVDETAVLALSAAPHARLNLAPFLTLRPVASHAPPLILGLFEFKPSDGLPTAGPDALPDGHGEGCAMTRSGSHGAVDPVTLQYVAGAPGVDEVVLRDNPHQMVRLIIGVSDRAMGRFPILQRGPGSVLDLGRPVSVVANPSGGFVTGDVYRTGPHRAAIDVLQAVGRPEYTTVLVDPAFQLVPQVSSQGSVTLSTVGAAGIVSYSMLTNQSGGEVDERLGVYHAGPRPGGSDVVAGVDARGNIAAVAVHVARVVP